ncbi:MAG: DUF2399 domain-containing protein [Nitriliruptorales bacterium]|nr:DUF2399 domain-containing protein [Nitriliruptorales bacterium]
MPDAAAGLLLCRLAEAGCDLALHADFDCGGVRIGPVLHRRYGARLWRSAAADYRAAVAGAARPAPASEDALWDANLAPAMRATARAVAEEQLLTSSRRTRTPTPASADAARPTAQLRSPRRSRAASSA